MGFKKLLFGLSVGILSMSVNVSQAFGIEEFQSKGTEAVKQTLEGKSIIYVKPGASGNGTSWSDPVGSFESALSLVTNDCNKDIWFAEGNYPIPARVIIPRTVSLYGGFKGTETRLEERDQSLKSIVEGGAFATLLAPKRIAEQDVTYIDGFVFTGTKREHLEDGISGNIELWGGRNIRNCIIRDNLYQKCSGVYAGDDAIIINCLFHDNVTTLASACVTIGYSAKIINSTIVRNSGKSNSWGGLRVSSLTNEIINTVIWGNTKEVNGAQVPYQVRIDNDNQGTFDHCAIEGDLTGGDVSWKVPGAMIECINLNAENTHAQGPGFIDTNANNYALNEKSRLIDKGNNIHVTDLDMDMNGNDRIQNNRVDIGAYETSVGAGFEMIQDNNILIYPNPVQNILFVQVPDAFRAEIFQITGKLVASVMISANGQIDLSSLESGYYQLILYTGQGQKSMPLIKK